MNQKSILIKKNNLLQNQNNNFSSFIGETKLSQIPKKEEDTIEHNNRNSSYYQYNLKYILSTQNRDYNKIIGNLNYLKTRRNKSKNNESKHLNNSYLVENSSKEAENNNNLQEPKTNRNFNPKKVCSQKYLNIKKNGIPKVFNNNDNTNSSNNNKDIRNINENESIIEPKDINYRNIISKNSNEEEYLKESKTSLDNNASLYNKLNLFLEKCKVNLNALDYEKIINLLKSFEINSNINIRKKVKKIINNNPKLFKLFEDIFESS